MEEMMSRRENIVLSIISGFGLYATHPSSSERRNMIYRALINGNLLDR